MRPYLTVTPIPFFSPSVARSPSLSFALYFALLRSPSLSFALLRSPSLFLPRVDVLSVQAKRDEEVTRLRGQLKSLREMLKESHKVLKHLMRQVKAVPRVQPLAAPTPPLPLQTLR